MMDQEDISGCLTTGCGGIYIDISVSPDSDKDSIEGFNPWRGCLEVRVKGTPKDGEANESILRLFDRVIEVGEGITITKGARSKRKRLFVKGVGNEEVVARISTRLKDDSI